jgi:F-type H+-transporting ATPase subunit a
MSALHISLSAEPVIHLGQLTLTNSMLASILGTIVAASLCIAAARRVALRPAGTLGQFLEAGSEALLTMIERVTNDRQRALQYFPPLATLFLFILVNNWLGLLPGVGTLVITTEHGTVPLLRGATADLNTTFALAIISAVVTQIYAVRRLGVFAHLKKYLSFNPLLLFVGILELVSEFSKVLSFSFRLFGNIFAGEVLLVVISFLVPAVAPLPFFVLELFVGFIQALVFTTLTLVFLEIASAGHGDHGQDRARDAPDLVPVSS